MGVGYHTATVAPFRTGEVANAAPLPAPAFNGSVQERRGARHGELHCLGLSGEDLMVGVDQLNPPLVLTRRHPGQVDLIVIPRVGPPPRQVINVDVQMPDPWRYGEGALPEHR